MHVFSANQIAEDEKWTHGFRQKKLKEEILGRQRHRWDDNIKMELLK